MSEPRYDEEEVREILARATELRPDSRALPPGEERSADSSASPLDQGLSLRELQRIGEEAGIPASRIAEAVADIERDRSLVSADTTHFGVALEATHDVRLPRMLTGDEWDRFVVRLRDTFDDGGTVTSEGSLRSWSAGGVTVRLEPLPEGARLRFESRDAQSKSLVDGGVAVLASGGFLGVVMGALVPITGKPLPGILLASVLGLLGVGGVMWALGRHGASTIRSARATDFSRLGTEVRRIASEPAS